MRIKCFFYLVVAFVCTSCTNIAFEKIDRTPNNPVDCEITASLFEYKDKIKITWPSDERADKYILYCAEDDGEHIFKLIYEGKNNFFIHDTAIEGKKYIYKLDKTRGDLTFYGSKYGFGIYSSSSLINWEYNNSKDNPKELSFNPVVEGTSYWMVFDNREPIFNEDWFSVEIPANTIMYIHFFQKDILNGQEYTVMYYCVDQQSGEKKHIKQDDNFSIENSDLIPKKMFFKVEPDCSNNQAGYKDKLISYSLYVHQIKKL